MNETIIPPPIVHILKEGKSYCAMPGVPGSWPDGHLYISFQDEENAKEANCPGCLARRESGPSLSERLNGESVRQYGSKYIIFSYPDGKGGFVGKSCPPLPDGVVLDASGFDAIEERTGQSSRFDRDLGRWV